MPTRPLAAIWPYALLFCVVQVWVYAPEFRLILQADRATKSRTSETRDTTFRTLIVGQALIIVAAIAAAFALPAYAMVRSRMAIFFLGLVLSIAGSLLRRHCFRMLGKDFRGAVEVRPGQTIVDRGAYRLVRHPSYSAAILMHLGLALSFTHWCTLMMIAIGIPPLFVHRIRFEERVLLAQLGSSYSAYMARTKRWVPGLL